MAHIPDNLARIQDNLLPRTISSIRLFLSSVRFRLTIWYVLILALVLFVFGSIIYASQAQSMSAELHNNLRADAERQAAMYDPVNARLDLPPQAKGKTTLGPDEIALALDTHGAITQQVGQIDDQDLRLLLPGILNVRKFVAPNNEEAARLLKKLEAAKQAGQDVSSIEKAMNMVPQAARFGEAFFPFTLGTEKAGGGGGSAGSNYLFYATPILVKDAVVGTLILGRPREDEIRLASILLTLLLAAPATLLVAGIGGYWLASRTMRPVLAITRAAREISDTELSRRLNLESRDELGELAGTFDGMLDRLETAFNRQRQFTADASHELRTPLTIVNLEANHALAAERSPQEYKRALSVIQAENECMARLVDQLLVLARADAGQAIVRREELDLSDLALEVAERLEPLARRNCVALRTGALPELRVRGDRLYLGQMLANLVENAIKYAPGGQGDNWVRVETGSLLDGSQPRAWVRVEDNGPGIPPEHLPHLFDRFYQVDKARSHNGDGPGESRPGGSGLGLAIVRWVAQAHGGEVLVDSRPGAGSVFEVRLPLADCC